MKLWSAPDVDAIEQKHLQLASLGMLCFLSPCACKVVRKSCWFCSQRFISSGSTGAGVRSNDAGGNATVLLVLKNN